MIKLFRNKVLWIILFSCLFLATAALSIYFIYFRKFSYSNSNYFFVITPFGVLDPIGESSFTPQIPTTLSAKAVSLEKDQRVQLLRDGYFLDIKSLEYSKLLEESKYPIVINNMDVNFLLKGMETGVKIKIRDTVLKNRITTFLEKYNEAIKDLESKSYQYPKDFNEELKKNKEWGQVESVNMFNLDKMSPNQLQNFKYILNKYALKDSMNEIFSILAYVKDEKSVACTSSVKDIIMGEIDKENLSKKFQILSTIMSIDRGAFDTEIKDIEAADPSFLIKYSCYVSGNFNLAVTDNNGELYSQVVDAKYIPTEVSNNNFSEAYDYPPVAQYPGTVRVPIFMYHQITAVPATATGYAIGLYVTPEMFEQQMAYLVSKNYKSITPKELYDLLAKGKNPPQKSVMITFDDGSYGEYLNAYPILKKYGMVGVFYIPTFKSSISKAQLKEMSDNGMVIDSHSRTHPNLQKETNVTKLMEEIAYSKADVASFTGKASNSIAYPGCVAGPEALNIVASSGYLIGVSCGRGIDHSFNNRLVLSRVHVFNDMKSFKKLLSGIN